MLRELIEVNAVKLNLESEDKDELFEEMTELLVNQYPLLSRQEVLDALLTREEKMSTEIVPGIAIPHILSEKVDKPFCALGRSHEGIDYDSPNGKVHIVIILVFPKSDSSSHINIMKHVALLLENPDFYKKVMEKNTAQQVLEEIALIEESL